MDWLHDFFPYGGDILCFGIRKVEEVGKGIENDNDADCSNNKNIFAVEIGAPRESSP